MRLNHENFKLVKQDQRAKVSYPHAFESCIPYTYMMIYPFKPPSMNNILLTSTDVSNMLTDRTILFSLKRVRERSGSVAECLTQDPRAVGSSLTGVTALCP